jgi:hypothetical protein
MLRSYSSILTHYYHASSLQVAFFKTRTSLIYATVLR